MRGNLAIPCFVIFTWLTAFSQPINPPRYTTRPPAPFPAPSTEETLRFRNGDSLRGHLISIDPQNGITWRRRGVKPDLHIQPDEVLRVTIQPGQPLTHKLHRSRVLFTNGDQLAGDVIAMNDQVLTLKTSYAGTLKIKRPALRVIHPGETTGKIIYEGPADPKGWVNNTNAPIPDRQKAPASSVHWSYHQGGFDSKGSSAILARNFPDLPDRAKLDFDVNWTSSLSLYINLHTDTFVGYSSGNTYSLRLNQTSAMLYKYESAPNRRTSARVGNSKNYRIDSANARQARISIRIDKPRHTIALVINHRLIAQWTDNGPFAGKGNGIMFTSRTSSPMRLHAIRFSNWDGALPATTTATFADDHDHLRLINNDTFSGQLHAISEGKATFTSAFSKKLPIPLSRISTITLTGKDTASAPMAAAVRFTLRNRGRLTAQLLQWKDRQAKLRHPDIGEFNLDAALITALDYSFPRTTQALPSSSRKRATAFDLNNPPVQAIPKRRGAGQIQNLQLVLPEKR